MISFTSELSSSKSKWLFMSQRADPKSQTFTMKPPPRALWTSRFIDLRSRCRMPCSCANAMPRAVSRPNFSRVGKSSSTADFRTCRSDRWEQYSVTMWRSGGAQQIPMNFTMLGWSSWLNRNASLLKSSTESRVIDELRKVFTATGIPRKLPFEILHVDPWSTVAPFSSTELKSRKGTWAWSAAWTSLVVALGMKSKKDSFRRPSTLIWFPNVLQYSESESIAEYRMTGYTRQWRTSAAVLVLRTARASPSSSRP
mmetsp:Transcript_32278/g.78604  ORF Transcript_32278/g.78604 Transcript_32278/m.78604 type:complete len:255 (+) Transcript_32278:803-1567(+)